MKRVFSFLLALLLVVGLVPVQAQADGEALLSVIWMTEDKDYIGETYVTTQSTATVSIPVPDGYIITNAQPEADTPGLINSSNWTVTMPGASVMILVTVAPDGSSPAPSRKYNVSVSPYIENGTFTVNKNEADTDDTILITPEPDSGYKLSYVVVYNAEADGIEFDATPNGDGTYSFVVQNFDITIGGGFEPDSGTDPQPPQQPDPQPPQQTTKYTVTVIPEGSGTASANVSEAAYGDTVTITTVPGEGNWAISIQGFQPDMNPVIPIDRIDDNYDNFVFTMPKNNVEITVVFGPYPTITPVAGEGGKLENVPGSAKPGTTVTFTPQPEAGYRVKDVIIESRYNGSVTPVKKDDGSYEFKMPLSDVVISVTFEEIPSFLITVPNPDHGKVTIEPNPAKVGDEVKVDADPDDGYEVKEIIIVHPDGEEEDITDDWKFIMPEGEVEVKVTFGFIEVKFVDGSNTVHSEEIKPGDPVDKVPQQDSEHKLFLGWYTEDGVRVSADDIKAGNYSESTTFYARYAEVVHTTNTKAEKNDFNAKIAMTDDAIEAMMSYLITDTYASTADALESDLHVYLDSKIAAVSEENKTVLASKAGDKTVAAYVDLTFNSEFAKAMNNKSSISNPGSMPLILDLGSLTNLPSGLNEDSFEVLRLHGGVVDTLDAKYNTATKMLTFNTDRFSSYAIVYKAPVATASAGVLDNVPKTGEGSALMNWTLLVLCSAAMLAAVAILDKKRAR